jgi:hypothetical protein
VRKAAGTLVIGGGVVGKTCGNGAVAKVTRSLTAIDSLLSTTSSTSNVSPAGNPVICAVTCSTDALPDTGLVGVESA